MVFQCYILFLHVIILQSIFRSFIGSRGWQDFCFLCCYINYLFIVVAVNFIFVWQLDILNVIQFMFENIIDYKSDIYI